MIKIGFTKNAIPTPEIGITEKKSLIERLKKRADILKTD